VAAVGLILALVIFQAGKTLLTPVDDSNIRLAGKLNAEKGQQNNKETAAQKAAQKRISLPWMPVPGKGL